MSARTLLPLIQKSRDKMKNKTIYLNKLKSYTWVIGLALSILITLISTNILTAKTIITLRKATIK